LKRIFLMPARLPRRMFGPTIDRGCDSMPGWAQTFLLNSPLAAVKPAFWAAIVAGGGILALREHRDISLLSAAPNPKKSNGETGQFRNSLPQPAFGSLRFGNSVGLINQTLILDHEPGRLGVLPRFANRQTTNAFAREPDVMGQHTSQPSSVLQSQLRLAAINEYAFERAFPVGSTPWTNPEPASVGDGAEPTPIADDANVAANVTPLQLSVAERNESLATPQNWTKQRQADHSELARAPQPVADAPYATPTQTQTVAETSISPAADESGHEASMGQRQAGEADAARPMLPQQISDSSNSMTTSEAANSEAPPTIATDSAPMATGERTGEKELPPVGGAASAADGRDQQAVELGSAQVALQSVEPVAPSRQAPVADPAVSPSTAVQPDISSNPRWTRDAVNSPEAKLALADDNPGLPSGLPSLSLPVASTPVESRSSQLGDAHTSEDPVSPALAIAPLPTARRGIAGGNYGALGNGTDLVVKAHMRGVEIGSLPLHTTQEGRITVRLRDIVDLIEPMVDWSEYIRLSSTRNAETFVSIEALRAAGIDARYDPVSQEISLDAE
jgi:hypothetical protein